MQHSNSTARSQIVERFQKRSIKNKLAQQHVEQCMLQQKAKQFQQLQQLAQYTAKPLSPKLHKQPQTQQDALNSMLQSIEWQRDQIKSNHARKMYVVNDNNFFKCHAANQTISTAQYH